MDAAIGAACRRVVAAGLLVLFVWALPAQAVEIRVAEIGGPDPELCPGGGDARALVLLVEGGFAAGDTERLRRAVEAIGRDSRVYVCGLLLDSPGGDLYEAMEMGRYIRSQRLATRVRLQARCYSACVFAFVGGVVRIPDGWMGIHSFHAPALLGGGAYEMTEALYTRTSRDVAQYLADMRVSLLILDRMHTIHHVDLVILRTSELRQLGIAGIDPVYAQSQAR